MLTFLAVVFVVVAATYFFSKQVLETPAPLIKVTRKEEVKTPEVVVETKAEPVKVKKTRKKTAPKAKKISAKKKAE